MIAHLTLLFTGQQVDSFFYDLIRERKLLLLFVSSYDEFRSLPKTMKDWTDCRSESCIFSRPGYLYTYSDFDIVIYNGLIEEDEFFFNRNKFIQEKVRNSIHITDDMTNTERLACGRRIEHF